MAHEPGDDEGFASRWSRLKQRARDDKARAAVPQPPAPAEVENEARKEPEEEKKPFDLSELPSVDFTAAPKADCQLRAVDATAASWGETALQAVYFTSASCAYSRR